MRPRSVLWILVILAVLGVAAAGAWAALFTFNPFKPGSTEAVVLEVRKGESPSEISRGLVAGGAIGDAKAFVWLGRITRDWKRVKAGEYQVSGGLTPVQIFGVLASGISIAHPVTVREGENIFEIADDISAKHLATREAFLSACRSSVSLELVGLAGPETHASSVEGFLFPDTYFFNRAMNAEDMIKEMLKKFLSSWSSDYDARARALHMNRFQVVTLASIVEKETGNPPDRPVISSVLHNRLKKAMRLQSDPTTIYGMWSRYRGNIHKSDLMDQSPYNTYVIAGLPIGPIGNPGIEAIKATLYPTDTRFLYFVSHNDGTTEFSETLDQHNRAVKKFQMDPKARQGKSWRDLTRKQTPDAH